MGNIVCRGFYMSENRRLWSQKESVKDEQIWCDMRVATFVRPHTEVSCMIDTMGKSASSRFRHTDNSKS